MALAQKELGFRKSDGIGEQDNDSLSFCGATPYKQNLIAGGKRKETVFGYININISYRIGADNSEAVIRVLYRYVAIASAKGYSQGISYLKTLIQEFARA